MELNEVKVDSKRIEEGAWIDNIPEMGDLRLKVRGIGNSDFNQLNAKLYEAVPRAKRISGQVDAKERESILSKCLLETVLVDWDGLTENKIPVPYSKEKAEVLLTTPDFRRFRDSVVWAANVVAETKAEDLKEAAGN